MDIVIKKLHLIDMDFVLAYCQPLFKSIYLDILAKHTTRNISQDHEKKQARETHSLEPQRRESHKTYKLILLLSKIEKRR